MVMAAQMVGVLSYVIVVYLTKSDNQAQNFPLYTGMISCISLIFLGLQFNKCNSACKGPVLPIALVGFILPIGLFFVSRGFDLFTVFGYGAVIGIANYIQLLNLGSSAVNKFYIFSIFQAALLPALLIINISFIFILITAGFVFAYQLHNSIECDQFKFSKNLNGPLLSIVIQAPFILLPTFDYLIFNSIGADRYAIYLIGLKLTNGPVNMLFSYYQAEILWRKIDALKFAPKICIFLFVLSIVLNIAGGYYYYISMVCYAFISNIGSLFLRSRMLYSRGGEVVTCLLSIFGVVAYLIILTVTDADIMINYNIYINYMIGAILLPILGVSLLFEKSDKKA